MGDELRRALGTMADRLVSLAATDDGIRDDLRAIALAVLAATDRQPVVEPEVIGTLPADSAEPAIVEEPAPALPMIPEPPRMPLPLLTLGQSRPPDPLVRPEPELSSTRPATADAELPAIEARCRLKAEGARWAATRRRLIDEGADLRLEIAPKDRDILDRAGELDAYLWMNGPDFASPRELSAMEDAAGCFEATADAVAQARNMALDIEGNREFFEPALHLLAEAQSALRVAVDRVHSKPDPDQFAAYNWLRGVAYREQIFLHRYMRLDDPADPAMLRDLERRIDALDTRFQNVRGRAKKKKELIKRLRYQAKRIVEGAGENLHHWMVVAATVDEMVADGVPASNLEIREVLMPILDRMPDIGELPPGFGLAIREIDRYQAGRPAPREADASEVPTEEVAEAARLLNGRAALMIGGCPRTEAREAIETAFGLEKLIWFETREHESIDKFAPSIARPEVAVVLLAIRWSSHSFGEVKRFCEFHDKPMVRLPRGYSPNQVAAEVVTQVSGHLEANLA